MIDRPQHPSESVAGASAPATPAGAASDPLAVQTLRRWLTSQLPERPTLHVVCDVLQLVPSPGGPEQMVPGPRPQLLKGTVAVQFSDARNQTCWLSPYSHATVLLPATEHALTIAVDADGALRLSCTLACSRADLERLARNPDAREVSIYVAADRAETLAHARTLVSGAWSNAADPACKGRWYPRPGLVSIVPETALADEPAAGPQVLLELEVSPFAGRFFQLPLAVVLAHATEVEAGLRVEFRIEVAENAALVASQLAGRLLLNQVLLTSRVRVLAETLRPLDAACELALDVPGLRRGERLVLLGARDWKSGQAFVEADWAVGCDPSSVVRLFERGDGWALRFPATSQPVWPRVHYLVPTEPAAELFAPGVTGFPAPSGTRSTLACVVRTVSCDVPVGAAHLVAAWLAAGPGAIPTAQAVTTDELRRLVARELPPPLRRALGTDGREAERIAIELQLHPAGGALHGASPRELRPIHVVTLALAPDAPLSALAPHARWLEHVVAGRVLAGAGVEIVLARDLVSRAC